MQRAPDGCPRPHRLNLFSLLEAEPFGQKRDVLPLVRRQLVSPVVGELELRRETADAASAYEARTHQARGCIARAAAVSEVLPAVAVSVELDRVDVDLASRRVPQDEASRQARRLVRGVDEADPRKRRASCAQVIATHDDVEIRVRARLPLEEGIDPPAAIDPRLHADRLQTPEDFEDVVRRQPERFSFPWRFA